MERKAAFVILFAAVAVSHFCFGEHGNVGIKELGISGHLKTKVRARLVLVRDSEPDPNCQRGVRSNLICCHPECTKCGGKGCGTGGIWAFCCKGAVWRSERYCMEVGPPCIIRPRPSSIAASPSSSSTAMPSTSPSPSPSPAETTKTTDPHCEFGIASGTACCASLCGRCGGPDCGSLGPNGMCCSGKIKAEMPPCTEAVAPCVIVDIETPITEGGSWENVAVVSGKLTPRHEACFVFVNGKGYLIGGRRQNAPVDVFDPVAKSWTQRAGYGSKLHHMQCVGYEGKVWIVSSWTGDYPYEQNTAEVVIYDTVTDAWSTRAGLPEGRRRGGAAAVLRAGKIYVVGGNRGGHGGHAATLGWMDAYDVAEGRWTTGLPELPEGRDHVGGAVVGGRVCVAGGRDSGTGDFFARTTASAWCFDFERGVWVRGEDLERPRAGAGTAGTCDGRMMVVGGETERGRAWARVDFFDGERWTRGPDLGRGRHGSGLGVAECGVCGKVFIASGSGNKGGSPELESSEVYTAEGGPESCQAF